MSQKDERQKAIEKARKLRDRAAGAGSSESEVEFAMKQFGELMDTFNLTMDEISLAGEECKMVDVRSDAGKTFRLGTVAVAVANFCDCVCYYTKSSNGYKVDAEGKIKRCGTTGRPLKQMPTFVDHFYGISSDVETAAFLMEMIRESAKKAVADFKKTDTYKTYPSSKLSLTKGFVDGFARRIVSRLNMMKHEREQELERARQAREEMGENKSTLDAERAAHERRKGNSTDLVALKEAKVQDDFKAKYGWTVKYTRGSRTGGNSYAGRLAGGNAAEKVNLSRPVGNGGNHSGVLKLGVH